MKRKVLKFVSSVLIFALLAASVPAFASSAYLYKVSVSGSRGSFIRSEAGEKIGSLKNGTRVLYWGSKKGQMLKVITSSGKIGYVYQGNLKRYGAMNTKQIYVTKSAATLYKRSGSKMKKKSSIGKGVPLVVYRTSGEWAYVRNMAGKAAYIQADELSKIS